MLVYFKVGNYKSIKEPVIINFNASSINEHVDSNVINIQQHDLLKSILLYGHNASGKSKILDALVFFRWLIVNSATDKQSNEPINTYFFELNSEIENKPSFFEACFIIDDVTYRYGFETNKEKIINEWLLESKAKKEYTVFLRIDQEFQINKTRFKNAEGLQKRTRKNALFLSVASQWNVSKAEKINDWFSSIYTVHGLMDNRYSDITIDLLKQNKYSKLITAFLNKADLGINKVEIVDTPIDVDEIIQDVPEELKPYFKSKLKDKQGIDIITVHNKYNEKNEIIGEVSFLLDLHESEGTKKYFNLIGIFVKSILENRMVIIDEFDARLHTLLTKAILSLYNSKIIKSQSQLLVASHDTSLLDREILRRDQIYFVEKNEGEATKVTSLVQYKPRKDTPYDKNYLDGKYGAIPFIGDLESILANGKQ